MGTVLLGAACATVPGSASLHAGGSGGAGPEALPICGGLASAPGWPDYSSGDEALLAPFLACASPAEFVELQRGVDMPRLVEALDDWSAVRLVRLPADVALLERPRPRVDAPPPGIPADFARWRDYVAYRERRLAELKSGKEAKGPLRWEGYEEMWGQFTRGLEFQRTMAALLRADAALPRAQRLWLRDFEQPSVETNVGVAKAGVPGVRFADVLVIEKRPAPGQLPRVEAFSFESRDFSLMGEKAPAPVIKADASAALRYYGEKLDIRRPSLQYLGPQAQVRRVRLVYEGGKLTSGNPALKDAANQAEKAVKGVEVIVQ